VFRSFGADAAMECGAVFASGKSLADAWVCGLGRYRSVELFKVDLGSGLIDEILKITVAAMQIADMKV